MSVLPKKTVRITIVRLMQHVSTYEDPTNVPAEKDGPIYQRIQHIREEYVLKPHWGAPAVITKVIASPTLSVKKYANASLGIAANVVKLISKVQYCPWSSYAVRVISNIS